MRDVCGAQNESPRLASGRGSSHRAGPKRSTAPWSSPRRHPQTWGARSGSVARRGKARPRPGERAKANKAHEEGEAARTRAGKEAKQNWNGEKHDSQGTRQRGTKQKTRKEQKTKTAKEARMGPGKEASLLVARFTKAPALTVDALLTAPCEAPLLENSFAELAAC